MSKESKGGDASRVMKSVKPHMGVCVCQSRPLSVRTGVVTAMRINYFQITSLLMFHMGGTGEAHKVAYHNQQDSYIFPKSNMGCCAYFTTSRENEKVLLAKCSVTLMRSVFFAS